MSVLKHIIEEMYVDPDLLEQLGDEQKQILFRKIREEQIRRWEMKERELELERAPPPSTERKVKFMSGSDGNPWVWIMGEHKDDLPYDQMIRQRETEKLDQERRSEIIEAESLAKKGIMSLMYGSEGFSVQERRLQIHGNGASESPDVGMIRTESQLDTSILEGKDSRSSMPKRPVRRNSIMIGETPEEQKKFKEERVAEVLGTLRRTKSIAKKRAEEMSKKLEDTWRESQRKANMFERSRKRSFIVARDLTAKTPNIHEKILDDLTPEKKKEIVRRMSTRRKPSRLAPLPPAKKKLLRMSSFVQENSAPKSSAHVLNWFKSIEAPKGVGKESDGTISVWFHGKIGREAAVRVLENEPFGSYLVRLSTKLWGYTVSLKTNEGSRHFLVDASSGSYNFLGPKQQKFRSLTSLLEYYKTNPVTWDGQEVLLLPVGLEDDRDVYGGLYSEDSDEDDSSTL